MTQHSIVQKSEKIVKEWIEYAKNEYGWKEELFELFEEPMIELCTSAATQSVKDFEKENAQLKEELEAIDKAGEHVRQQINDAFRNKRPYWELEKENAELDCQKNRNKFCYSCANATERCFTNEIGCPCEKYKSYKDENAELNEKLFEQKQYTEFKCNEAVKKKELYEKEHFLLTKAKELLNEFIRISKASDEVFEHDYSELIGETEQLLKEYK